jgi:hypothetical protein
MHQINKVKIAFMKKKMTAYGGFALIASFFGRIAFIGMVYAGAERFSHLAYLGNKEALVKIFGVKKLPAAATTLTIMFNRIATVKTADIFSNNVWAYLSHLISWHEIKEDWLTFDSSVLPRYGEQEGAKKGYNPVKHSRPSHHPLLAFFYRFL